MKLGEKIVKLRKERGLSQEALAEQIGTTRQAVSKWENDQGFPETEKLLQLSNVFEVSVDFLLKDEKTETGIDEKGYYVSREFARGYLANEKKTVLSLGLCFFFQKSALQNCYSGLQKLEKTAVSRQRGAKFGVSLAPMASPAPSWLKNSAVGATLGPAWAMAAGALFPPSAHT